MRLSRRKKPSSRMTSTDRRRNSEAASQISSRQASTRLVCSSWPTDAIEYFPNDVISQRSRENSTQFASARRPTAYVVFPEQGSPEIKCVVAISDVLGVGLTLFESTDLYTRGLRSWPLCAP